MLDKASLKLGLDRAVLQSMSGNKDSSVNGVWFYSFSFGSVAFLCFDSKYLNCDLEFN